jgi:hypothetical protein
MKKRTIFLIALVVFFPLNNLPSYANGVSFKSNIAVQSVVQNEAIENSVQPFLNAFPMISADALKAAITGYTELNTRGKITKKDIITVIDFSKPSTEERLFIIDLKCKKIIEKSLCAHGKNSGELFANKFSNAPESNESSLGFYIANETYDGKHGYSLKLDGQEPGINDKARDRGVVMHAADYVSQSFIQATGRLGRSQGCPAVPTKQYEKIISLIKGGSCLFIYHPDKYYSMNSPLLKHYNESCFAEAVSALGE